MVGDLAGGEIIRCYAGVVRVTHRTHCSWRWCIPLRPDLTEEREEHIWLAPMTKVLEVIR